MRYRALVAATFLLVGACSTAAQTRAAAVAPSKSAPAPSCALAAADRAFAQDALDTWRRSARDVLGVDVQEPPAMVFYDRRCAYYVALDDEPDADLVRDAPLRWADADVVVRATPHGGEVRLPSGARVPASAPAAYASLYERGGASRPFFVLALLEVWRAHPKAKDSLHLVERIAGVSQHELAHTVQLPKLKAVVASVVGDDPRFASLDDDVVQKRFGDDAAFTAAWTAERDLWFAAAGATAGDERRDLARRASAAGAARRARFFVGADAPYAALEDVFVVLEGTAEVVRYHDTRRRLGLDHDAAVAFMRGTTNDQVQDHGLGMMLVVAALVPDWGRRVVADPGASPYALIDAALGAP